MAEDPHFVSRRHIQEYPLWATGLRGSARVLVSVVGTVWSDVFTKVVVLAVLTAVVAVLDGEVHRIDVHVVGHQIVLTPVSFLLVFRCSNAYQRYWEGRTLLSSLAHHSSEVCSLASSLQNDSDPTRTAFSDNVMRYTKCLIMVVLRDVQGYWDVIAMQPHNTTEETDMNGRAPEAHIQSVSFLQPFLTALEYEDVRCESPHGVCVILLTWLRGELDGLEVGVSQARYVEFWKGISGLHLVWMDMVQLTATLLPFPWMHLSRLVLWAFLLSLIPAAVSDLRYTAIPFIAVTSFLLLGLLRIGSELEDPFGNDINDFDLADFEKNIIARIDLCSAGTQRRKKGYKKKC